jgi:hypothetical protein
MTHNLKTIPIYFDRVANFEKLFEVRKNDRDFQVGDTLILKEWFNNQYTGKEISCKVTYVLYGFEGLKKGYVGLGISIMP